MEQKYKTLLQIGGAIAASGLLMYILSHRPNKSSKRAVDRMVENEPSFDESMFGDVPYFETDNQKYSERRV